MGVYMNTSNWPLRVTARWYKVSLSGFSTVIDVICVNDTVYSFCKSVVSNKTLEQYWRNGGNLIADRIEEIMESGDPYNVLHILQKRTPDWICGPFLCECGSEKIYGPNNTLHSHWCPKHPERKT